MALVLLNLPREGGTRETMACIELQIKLIFPVYYNVSFYIEGGESPEQRLSCTGLLRKAQLKDHLVNLR